MDPGGDEDDPHVPQGGAAGGAGEPADHDPSDPQGVSVGDHPPGGGGSGGHAVEYGGEEEEYEGEGEEEEEEGMLDAEHAMLRPIQAALTKQLETKVASKRNELANKVTTTTRRDPTRALARLARPLCAAEVPW
jgi:hypothetical protein